MVTRLTLEPPLGIGELAGLTGVPVRTIRFYCDEGILEPVRSAGGHRRFDPSAVERLRLVRRLRGLGLGLSAIADVLGERYSIAEAVAAERAALDVELAALAWRRASLRAIEEADPADRAARLELLSAVMDGSAARAALLDFWRGIAVAPLEDEIVDAILHMVVPEPPAAPAPEHVVAYAELVVLTSDRALTRRMRDRAEANLAVITDEVGMLLGVAEACELAEDRVRAGAEPGPGVPLDAFVAAHAAARRRRDTPEFRRELNVEADIDRDPRLMRYWTLAGQVMQSDLVPNAGHTWLLDALHCWTQEAAAA
jgi:DNA-binding transcriptional MerR regulator